jgi:diguanylate cyclase (GGDEF)-like protein
MVGNRMNETIRIDTWINSHPVVMQANEILGQGLQRMAAQKIGAILVMERGMLAGIFTERDLLKLLSNHSEEGILELLTQPVERFMTREPVTAQASDDYNSVYMKMKTHNIRHIPVLDGKRLAGIVSMRDLLHFYQNKLESAFNDARRELESLRQMVSYSSSEKLETLVQEINRYRELSLTDELTGLFNKRYFLARLTEEIARARRHNGRLALIFCDIDRFKNVNDNYGHPVGDEVLRQTAGVLTGTMDELNVISRLRKSDIVARYGGEEFVVILPETGREGAAIAAEKMRRAIEEHPFVVDNLELRLTMSFGVAELVEEDQDQSGLINNADYAMYRAKNNGRNKVVAYPDEPS